MSQTNRLPRRADPAFVVQIGACPQRLQHLAVNAFDRVVKAGSSGPPDAILSLANCVAWRSNYS